MTPQEVRQRFLNAIAGPESAGRYDVRYTPKGGATFTGFESHPRIFERGPKGPSSAAGRYQITATTYDRLGGGAFTPEAQDAMAWRLGIEDYKKRTGRNLEADLREQGLTPQIMETLAPTWTGLSANPQRAVEWFNRPIAEGGSSFRPLSADTAQIGSPAAAPAPTAPTAAAKQPAPVYANDIGTTARRFGNFLAPSLVDAPTPLAPEEAQKQIDEERRMQSEMSRANDAMRAFSAISSYGQQMGAQQRPSLLQPSVVRGQFRPITMGRGLL